MSDSTNSSVPESELESERPSRQKPQFSSSGHSAKGASGKPQSSSKTLIFAAGAAALLAVGVLGWNALAKRGVESPKAVSATVLSLGAEGGELAAPMSAASAPKSTADNVRDLIGEVKSIAGAITELVNGQRQTNEALTRLEGEVLAMRTDIDEMQAKQVAAARPVAYKPRVRKVAPKPAEPVPPPAPQAKTELLGVDVWNGRPSVAVKTGIPGDSKVRFLHEGDATPNAYVQKASAEDQRVVFGLVGGQQVVLTRDPE